MGSPQSACRCFFVVDYSGWLYWFGHNMNEMGAFTVKAFMPTVFGDARWPSSPRTLPVLGFGLMIAFAVVVGMVVLIRKSHFARCPDGLRERAMRPSSSSVCRCSGWLHPRARPGHSPCKALLDAAAPIGSEAAPGTYAGPVIVNSR